LHQVGIERTLTHIWHELLYQIHIVGRRKVHRSIDPEDQIDIGNSNDNVTTVIVDVPSKSFLLRVNA